MRSRSFIPRPRPDLPRNRTDASSSTTGVSRSTDVLITFDRAERILTYQRWVRRAVSALALTAMILTALSILDYPREVAGMRGWQIGVAQCYLAEIADLQRIHFETTGRYSDNLLELGNFENNPLFRFAIYASPHDQLYQAVAVGRPDTVLAGQIITDTSWWTHTLSPGSMRLSAPIALIPSGPREFVPPVLKSIRFLPFVGTYIWASSIGWTPAPHPDVGL